MIGAWPAIAIFTAALVAVLWGTDLLRRRLDLEAELTRKIVHVTMGLVCLSFPWLFDRTWPVAALAAGTVAIMAALRSVPALRDTVGRVLGGVGRVSLGEFYYPVAVAATFALAERDPILFCVPVLILTLADALAAIVGRRYGARRFTTLSDRKSVEGSAAFFAVAFASSLLPLLLFTDVGRLQCVLVAATLGLVVMMVEAVSWQGLDNLLIPIGSFVLLRGHLERATGELAALLGITVVLLAVVLLWRRHTTLKDSGLLAGALVGYFCFAWGGWQWLVAPLALFMTHALLWPPPHASHPRRHEVPAVISVTSGGLLWLLAMKGLGREDFLYPYTISFAAHLALIGVARLRHARPEMPVTAVLASCVLRSWVVIFVPYVLVMRLGSAALALTALAPLAVAASAGAFLLIQPDLEGFPTDRARWVRQALAALAGSALGVLPLSFAPVVSGSGP